MNFSHSSALPDLRTIQFICWILSTVKPQSSLPGLWVLEWWGISGIINEMNALCWDRGKERKQVCAGTGHSNHKQGSGSPFLSDPHFIYTSQTETPLLQPLEFLLWCFLLPAMLWSVFSAVTHENMLNTTLSWNLFGVSWFRSPKQGTGQESLLQK